MSNQSEAIFTAIIANAGTEDATIILPGSSTATRKRYKYALTGQQLSTGDRVYVIPISGTYVLLGGAVASGGDWVTQEELEEALEPHDQVITPYTVGPSSVAAFDASVGGVPLNDLTVSIEPVQAGSGDPSPTNVRPITGRTGCNIHVSPTTTGGTVYPVSWEDEAGTVYGGTLDVTTGLLTVDRAMVDLGTLTWAYLNDGIFRTPKINDMRYRYYPNWICSAYSIGYTTNYAGWKLRNNQIGFLEGGSFVICMNTAYTDTTSFTEAMNGQTLVYELAAPITYQLTPLDVLTLEGRNNIWADCGPVTVTYGDYVKTVYDRIQQGGGGIDISGASVGDLIRVAAVDASGKPTSWIHVPLNAISCSDNLLDNWYFLKPVNQRGQQSYTNPGYTIDRWKLTSGSLTVGASGVTLNGTLVQIRETSIGQPVTCSALLSDGTMIVPTYDDTTKTFSITATGQTIVAAKMELEDEQTLAHWDGTRWVLNEIPDYQQVLARCQRFYVASAMFPPGNFYGNVAYFDIPLPVSMARYRPAVTWSYQDGFTDNATQIQPTGFGDAYNGTGNSLRVALLTSRTAEGFAPLYNIDTVFNISADL